MNERDDLRVAMTKDVAAGYRVIVFIRIHPPNVELKWVEIEPLEED